MEEIRIVKIKRDNNFISCNLKLILSLKKIEGDMPFEEFKKTFNLQNGIISIPQQDIILEDENGINYFCCNCIFKMNLSFDTMNTNIQTVHIDYICVNSDKEIDDLFYKILEVKFDKSSKCNRYLSNFSFKLNKNIIIEIGGNYIKINSINEVKYSYLWDNFIKIYELLYLYIGTFFEIDTISYIDVNSKVIGFISELPNKYNPQKKACIVEDHLVDINLNSINKSVIKNWKKLRKDTLQVIDVFMQTNNIDELYLENRVCMLLQCMEGFYRCTHTDTKEFWEILDTNFSIKRETANILSTSDKRKIPVSNRKEKIFLYKAKNHRNYFSHLNKKERKSLFYGLQTPYAYWKINLCFRIILLNYLSVNYDKNRRNTIISIIDSFKKKYKFRLNAK